MLLLLLAITFPIGVTQAGKNTALEKLKQDLQSPKDAIRANAIRQAKIPDEDAAQAAKLLAPFLGDKSASVQQAAIVALGALKAKAVPVLAEALKSPDDRRKNALIVLRQIGPDAKSALPTLSELATDKDVVTRRAVMAVFTSLGEEARPASKTLVDLLRDTDALIRSNAEVLLGRLGPDAIPPLSEALARTDDLTKWTAVVRILQRLQPKDQPLHPAAARELTRCLSDKNLTFRLNALRTIGEFGAIAAKPTAPAVAKVLESANRQERDLAVNTLLKLGPDASAAVMPTLKHANPETRHSAVMVVGGWAVQKKELAKEIFPLLKDNDDRVRIKTASLLGAINGDEVVPALASAMHDTNATVRIIAAQSLVRVSQNPSKPLAAVVQSTIFRELEKVKDPAIQTLMLNTIVDSGPPSKETTAELTKRLKDPRPEVRSAMIGFWLRKVPAGPDPRAYLEPVVAGLSDRDWATRRTAALGLTRLGNMAILTDIVENGEHPFARAEAIHALSIFGVNAKPALKQIAAAARDPNLHVRLRALAVLNALSPDAVADLVDDPDIGVRVSALDLIQRDAARTAQERMLKLLSHRDEETRTAAARAFHRIGSLAAADLIPMLKDKDARVRRAAIQILDGQATPNLLGKYLADVAPEVREAAAVSLAKQGPNAYAVIADGLRSTDFRVQRSAAEAITPIVERADDLIPFLVEAMLAKEPGEWIGRAILRVNPVLGSRQLARQAKPGILVALLQSPIVENRLLACMAIKEHGGPVDGALPLLAEIVKNPRSDAGLLAAAVRALHVAGAMDVASQFSPELIARLVKGTHEKSKRLREEILSDQPASWKGASMESILAALYIGEFTGEANEWIVHHANSQNTLGWGSPNFVRVLCLFHSGSKRFPRRLSPNAEIALKDHFWRYLHEQGIGRGHGLHPLPADVKATLPVDRLVWVASAYLALDVLKDDPVYSDRLIQGRPIRELYDDWTLWWRDWAKHRASHGLWSEMGLASHQFLIWPCMLNMIDCASDPIVKQRCKMLLDITVIEEEQISIQGTRTGRRGKKTGLGCGIDQWKDLLFGELPRRFGEECAGFNGIIWTTSYEMPTAAILLRKLDRPVAHYSIWNQNYFNGSVFGYASPHYVLASQLSQPAGSMEFPGTWHRLVFDDMNAIFFPHFVGSRRHFQYKNVYVMQSLRGGGERQTIELTANLKVTERGGWCFVSNGPAFAAIYVVGGYDLEKEPRKELGPQRFRSLATKDPQAAVLLHAGDALTFGSFEKFQAAILAAPLKISNESLQYTGPRLLALEFPFFLNKAPLVGGEPQVYRSTTEVFDSPYLHAKVDSAQITVGVASYSAVYDFDKSVILEAKAKSRE